MRCTCCDHILSDFEATRKFKSTGEYADMCSACVREIPDEIEFIVRGDLVGDTIPEDTEFDDDTETSD